jgi:hypothetical protein
MGINMTKVCAECKQTKQTAEFSKCKSNKDGLQRKCKSCKLIEFRAYKLKNPNLQKQNYQDNKQRYKINHQSWLEQNPTWEEEYKPTHQVKSKQWRENNPNYFKEWVNQNRIHYNEYQNEFRQTPLYKLHDSIANAINQSFKRLNKSKQSSTLEILGLESWDKLREHIESQWIEGMSWENYGNTKESWSIDHFKPKSLAKTEEEVKKLNHYTNLRPMWHVENIRKRNKII